MIKAVKRYYERLAREVEQREKNFYLDAIKAMLEPVEKDMYKSKCIKATGVCGEIHYHRVYKLKLAYGRITHIAHTFYCLDGNEQVPMCYKWHRTPSDMIGLMAHVIDEGER